MRSFALIYLAILTSAVIAAPRPAPAPQNLEEIVSLLPPDDPNQKLGPEAGTAPPAPEPLPAEVVAEAVEHSSETEAVEKRGLTKRYTVTLPSGYFFAFKDKNGATEHSSYKTYKSLPVGTPDFAKACTNFCDATVGCTFANLYTEKFGPNAADQVIKCSLYGLPSGEAQATNVGQWRNGYLVTISKSYGFSKTLSPNLAGWTEESLNGAINAKRTNPTDPDPYMGYSSIEFTDPELCAQACDAKTAFNSQHGVSVNGTYRACNFFNFYILKLNGVPYKTICSFYLKYFDSSYATNHGYTSGSNVYTIGDSWSFKKDVLVGTDGIVTVA